MRKNTNVLEIENEESDPDEGQTDSECSRCGEKFLKPILARVSSNGSIQTYYACPRCLTDISEAKKSLDKRSEETMVSPKQVEAPEKIEGISCAYTFGYLKKRSKGEPIPDTCLTCEKMIECLTQ